MVERSINIFYERTTTSVLQSNDI
eukprot:SAG31_NODE_6190_length_2130_cov_1.457410_1_plen_23_part_10